MENILDSRPSVEEAKAYIENFVKVNEDVNRFLLATNTIIEDVVKHTKAYIDVEIAKVLKEIDISEINKGKVKIRTSLLKNAGYTNFYKIYKLTDTSKLSKIDGISSDAAYMIKNIVHEDVKRLKENTTPRLSSDNKNANSNNLIKAIFVYKNSKKFVESMRDLNDNYHLFIENSSKTAIILTNKLKWFFASKTAKMDAISAFNKLKEIESENYLIDAKFLLESLQRVKDTTISKIWKDFESNSAEYYAILEKLSGINFDNVASKNGLSKDLVDSINDLEPDFAGLKCILRSYQEFGTKYILHQGYVLLGDEMGLGKTVQAIASMVALRNYGENRFLVVCPASVLINWCREINFHSDLQVFKLHGDYREVALQDWIKYGGVGVTTYETLDKLDLTNVFNISMLVADEAHYVKNPFAERTINLSNACDKAERVLFMTGTALENRIGEMRYLISLLNPEVKREIQEIEHLSQAQMFREKVAPVYLRRTREDVLQELPDLIQTDEWCEMNEEEKSSYYDSVNSENFMAMRQLSWDVSKIENSSKAKRLVEICEEAKNEKRKIIVFSFFLKTIEKVKKLLKDRCYGPINGSVDPADRQKIIDEFSKGKDGSVLLAQIQAGGTGVNIQAASCVILCEPQLKPSTENQAISRTYRMGQTRNVQVFRLLCADSIDEKIVEILNTKSTIFENFANTSVVGEQSLEIDKEASKAIVAQEKQRIEKQKTE